MTALSYLTNEQISTIKQYFPKSRGKARASDKKVISGIIYVLKNGLRWLDAPKAYGSHKTLYNRYIRWSKLGIWEKIFTQLASADDLYEHLQLDSSHIKAHRTACSLKNDGKDRGLGRTKGGINSKLQLLCSHQGLPVALLVTSGNQSDHKGAKQMK